MEGKSFAKEPFKRLFNLKIIIFILICIIALVILICKFQSEEWFDWVTAAIVSVLTSFLLGAFFQFSIQDEISKEHLSIMEFLNEKNKSGILKYYGSFKNSVEEIKKELRQSKQTNIYVVYGYTIFNDLSEEISFKLSQAESVVNIYIMDPENAFVKSYSKHWYEDDGEKVKLKIEESKNLLLKKTRDLSKRGNFKGELNIYLNKVNPVNYSFYLFDNKVFYVPSKNVTTKEFIPLCIMAEKTSDPSAIYNKIAMELDMMKKDNCFKKIKFEE